MLSAMVVTASFVVGFFNVHICLLEEILSPVGFIIFWCEATNKKH